jgi:ABC-type multidrug transport system fused ATPase/permease subunit
MREDITVGLEHEPPEKQVQTACRQANVLEFVMPLPQGLKQRIQQSVLL